MQWTLHLDVLHAKGPSLKIIVKILLHCQSIAEVKGPSLNIFVKIVFQCQSSEIRMMHFMRNLSRLCLGTNEYSGRSKHT